MNSSGFSLTGAFVKSQLRTRRNIVRWSKKERSRKRPYGYRLAPDRFKSS
jgi:hypothetical protein